MLLVFYFFRKNGGKWSPPDGFLDFYPLSFSSWVSIEFNINCKLFKFVWRKQSLLFYSAETFLLMNDRWNFWGRIEFSTVCHTTRFCLFPSSFRPEALAGLWHLSELCEFLFRGGFRKKERSLRLNSGWVGVKSPNCFFLCKYNSIFKANFSSKNFFSFS